MVTAGSDDRPVPTGLKEGGHLATDPRQGKAPRILGAIFAGGQARRFGGDKAAALVDGMPLIERVARVLAVQCAELAVVGRDWPGLRRVDDRPMPGLGPLGGLAGAMTAARDGGFDLVLTSGCDLPDLPSNLSALLAPADAVVAGQPLLGLWRARHAERLVRYLSEAEDHSLRGWIAAVGAREVPPAAPLANINTPDDLARYLTRADRPPSP